MTSRRTPTPPARAVSGLLPALRARLRSPLLARVLLLTSSSILAQLIVVASLPIVSRLFSPAELGLAALVGVAVSFGLPIICLRYDGAVPLAPKAAEAARLVIVCLAASLVVGVAVYLAFRLLLVTGWLGFGALPAWTHWIVLASLPGLAFYAIGQAWWLRRGKAGVIGVNLVLRPVAHNGVRIAAGLGGGGLVGLMVAEAAMALTSLSMVVRMPWRRIIGWTGPVARWREAAGRWRRFPLLEGPSSVLDSFVVFLPIPLVATLYGAEAAGLFAIAMRIGSIPIGQIGAAISSATYMDFSAASRRGDSARMNALFYRMLGRLLLFGIAPMAALALLGPLLAGPILGSEWATAGLYLALMTPWLYAQLAVVPLSRIISVLQRQDLKLVSDFGFLISLAVSYWASGYFALQASGYVLLLSLLMALSYTIYFLVIRLALKGAMAPGAGSAQTP